MKRVMVVSLFVVAILVAGPGKIVAAQQGFTEEDRVRADKQEEIRKIFNRTGTPIKANGYFTMDREGEEITILVKDKSEAGYPKAIRQIQNNYSDVTVINVDLSYNEMVDLQNQIADDLRDLGIEKYELTMNLKKSRQRLKVIDISDETKGELKEQYGERLRIEKGYKDQTQLEIGEGEDKEKQPQPFHYSMSDLLWNGVKIVLPLMWSVFMYVGE